MPSFRHDENSQTDPPTGQLFRHLLESQYNSFESMSLFRHYEGTSHAAPLNHLENSPVIILHPYNPLYLQHRLLIPYRTVQPHSKLKSIILLANIVR